MSLRVSSIRNVSVVLIACWGIANTARAQDFKIYTPLFDMNAPKTSPRAGQPAQSAIVGRSQSYFHAGKAYDSIEARQQVLIYEPTAQRFTILNTSRGMVTTISFEEIEKLVRTAEEKAQEHVLRSRENKLEQTTRSDMIEFQLQPSFNETFDRDKNLLTLKSAYMNYEVRCAAPDSPERFEFYLKYCDWMARLNYLLHPQAPLPGPRLTLNGSLKKHGVMPVEVTLKASIGAGINLKAEH